MIIGKYQLGLLVSPSPFFFLFLHSYILSPPSLVIIVPVCLHGYTFCYYRHHPNNCHCHCHILFLLFFLVLLLLYLFSPTFNYFITNICCGLTAKLVSILLTYLSMELPTNLVTKLTKIELPMCFQKFQLDKFTNVF